MSDARPLGLSLALSLALAAAAMTAPVSVASQQAGNAVVNQSDNALLRPFRWRSIGPIGQGGRVDDIAVHPTDTRIFYVGFATGGLWKTTNNGTTFEPIFDEYETHSIGAIGIAPSDPEVLYIGTGEANNRQSSSYGAGVYKTTDGGETCSRSASPSAPPPPGSSPTRPASPIR